MLIERCVSVYGPGRRHKFQSARSPGRSMRPSRNSTKQKRLPGGAGAASGVRECECVYCVGRIICVKPMVFTSRSIGVSGGSRLGVRKFVSN